ncbi:hypothetical protein LRS05_11530 [Flavobacterium sp. J372]|uniref:hypothetical protein n=1 Tax=Flavobacterium sp. J372 TaxID=2898436 RepID=UPI002150CAF5|nr:hypothetical protein [Flavobacterium sp. J372]MCR5862731.1 hypothetical protein [Flavobacterium sp. J372]
MEQNSNPIYSFDIKNSTDLLRALLEQHSEFRGRTTSTPKALALAMFSFHLTDWVAKEHFQIRDKSELGGFRKTLYPVCPSLKIMHDIANGAKHLDLDPGRAKGQIETTTKNIGPFSNIFSKQFDQTALYIIMANGDKLYFEDEIEKVVNFWKEYFKTKFDIDV